MIQIIKVVFNLIVGKFSKIEELSIIIIRCNIVLSNALLVMMQKHSHIFILARCKVFKCRF